MRFAWSTALLPAALSLACSNEAPPLVTDTNSATEVQGESTAPSTSPTQTSQEATSDAPPTTGGDDSFTGTGTATSPPGTSTSVATTEADTTMGVGETTGGDSTGPETSTQGTTASESSTGAPDPSCQDGAQNGDETDEDCGGALCDPCAADQTCMVESDCASNVCSENSCAAPTCVDIVKNGDETDIDCGGDTCDACQDGESCVDQNDCLSGVCKDQLCEPASCADAVKNQDESDVDCGGATCDPCLDGDECLVEADCVSGVCLDNVCEAATCEDGVKNQDESDIDCGGDICAPCQLMGLILNEVDYDTVGTDNAEFVEIYNNTGAPVSLVGVRLILVNGSNNTPYLNLDLSSGVALAQGQYLVVANADFVVPPEAVHVNFAKLSDNLQNDVEGVALVDTAANKLLDALSYEGSVTMANLPGLGVTSLVEGAAFGSSDNNNNPRTLSRWPNGNDKNNAATDWVLSTTPTPGVANKK
jgi:hypothetical protein